jgi:hypothetical protein
MIVPEKGQEKVPDEFVGKEPPAAVFEKDMIGLHV